MPAKPTRKIVRRAPETRSRGRRAFVVVLAGERMGEAIPLGPGRTSIGRGVTADLRINDEGISRSHAAVVLEGGVYFLTDAGSTNGTFANGERVTRHALREGDRIQLGAACVLRFTHEQAAGEDRASAPYAASLRDPLTGLFSQSYFESRLESDVAAALRHGRRLALALLELDGSDTLAGAHGEGAVAAILRGLGETVRAITRESDVLARHGAAGFGLVCRDADAIGAARAAARIRETVAARSEGEGEGQRVSVSLGVCDLASLHEPSAAALVEAALKALRIARRGGGDRVEIYDPENEATHHV